VQIKKVFFVYSAVILILGGIGFVLTRSPTSLIGPAMAFVVLLCGFFIDKNPQLIPFTQIWILLNSAMFSWRFNIALQSYLSGNTQKFVPLSLLGLMALSGIISLFFTLKKRP
jgi:hypothetical protein